MENCIEFDIFIQIDDTLESKKLQQHSARENESRPQIGHEGLSDAIHLHVQNAKETINNFCKRWTHEYIWHKDGFNIDEAKDYELDISKSGMQILANKAYQI